MTALEMFLCSAFSPAEKQVLEGVGVGATVSALPFVHAQTFI